MIGVRSPLHLFLSPIGTKKIATDSLHLPPLVFARARPTVHPTGPIPSWRPHFEASRHRSFVPIPKCWAAVTAFSTSWWEPPASRLASGQAAPHHFPFSLMPQELVVGHHAPLHRGTLASITSSATSSMTRPHCDLLALPPCLIVSPSDPRACSAPSKAPHQPVCRRELRHQRCPECGDRSGRAHAPRVGHGPRGPFHVVCQKLACYYCLDFLLSKSFIWLNLQKIL
jgi:hypothetical protein